MLIHIGVAKTNKWAKSESGDTVEVVERRLGGISGILVDGQGSGEAAKRISSLVVARAIALIAEGARDGAVVRAAHDALYASRGGKVSADLAMLSVDLNSGTLVVTKNGRCLLMVRHDGCTQQVGEEAPALGIYAGTRPWIREYSLMEGSMAVAMSDGVVEAGQRYGQRWAGDEMLSHLASTEPRDASELAHRLLETAVGKDKGRPLDDMAVMVVGVGPGEPDVEVRGIEVVFPARRGRG